MDRLFTTPVVLQAIKQAPLFWEGRRTQSWAAIIHIDPRAPGGLARKFINKAKGDFLYMVDQISVGDALEFGAKSSNSSGKVTQKEQIYAVCRENSGNLILEMFDSSTDAVEVGAAIKAGDAPAPRTQTLEQQLIEIDREIAILQAKRTQLLATSGQVTAVVTTQKADHGQEGLISIIHHIPPAIKPIDRDADPDLIR